ncbi:phage terminase small subunit [Comamonas sp. Y33R10-2]|uniref:phage terminase small subunit n=1 Tax=Comamonas sp. Y33R10-2 TaxID=2853257 RepID=UPI002105972D|nr:phage terminase small subunit [Comamonas sp. Y33R10-2]
MPMTPAQRHRARVLAAQQAEAAAATDPHGPMQGAEHELMLAQLHQHLRTLKGIQSVERKIEAKRTMLADFDNYLDGVLEADAGAQDPVVTTTLVWHLDVGNWLQGLQLADYAIRHQLALPDQYNRNLATLLLDEVSEAALKGQITGQQALVTLAKVDQLTTGHDAHDQARAKLHKAIGWACMGKTSTQDVDVKELQLDMASLAIDHLTRAMALNDKVGVKKDVERLERRIKDLLGSSAAP